MLLYRISHRLFSKELSAPGISGRWNGAGKKVIYCGESIALAFLENMVRRQGVGFNDDYKIMILAVPDDMKIQVIQANDLPAGWRSFTDYSKCQPLGDRWYDEGDYPLLKVPSATLPESFNYVINALHKDYNRIKLLQVTELVPDERIETLLKQYPAS